MSLLTLEELRTLVENRQGPFVSIYMPARQAGPETRENPIRLKNLVNEAQEQLVASGLRVPEARKLLQSTEELEDDFHFWQHQSQGLAVFASPELFRTYRLPLEFKELVIVADRFHLKPLMPLLSGDGQFYILALSQNEVRLFQGSRYDIDQLEAEDLPESLEEALWYELPQKQQQFHTATSESSGRGGPRGDRPAIFHGHGTGEDDQKEAIFRYFRQVDKGMQSLLQNEQAPLVLAAVDYLIPIYQEANTYSHLAEQGIVGNPEELKPDELRRQAWSIMKPIFQKDRQEAATRFHHLSDTEQATTDIRQIIPAAHYGRVDTLFVAVHRQQWGTFDPDTNTIDLHAETKPGDEDLLDSAAIQTLLNGGTVYAVEPEKVPGEAPMAAIFRY